MQPLEQVEGDCLYGVQVLQKASVILNKYWKFFYDVFTERDGTMLVEGNDEQNQDEKKGGSY